MPYPFILTRDDNKYYATIEISPKALSDCDSIKFWRVFKYVYVPALITYMCSAYKHCYRYGLISNYQNSATVYMRKRQFGWCPIESI